LTSGETDRNIKSSSTQDSTTLQEGDKNSEEKKKVSNEIKMDQRKIEDTSSTSYYPDNAEREEETLTYSDPDRRR
jgi:hypothetical protein